MKQHRNITLSLPQELIFEMHLLIQKRGISHFVEEAITEKLKKKKNALEQQYMEAAQDDERNKIAAEWDILAGEGLNDKNEW